MGSQDTGRKTIGANRVLRAHANDPLSRLKRKLLMAHRPSHRAKVSAPFFSLPIVLFIAALSGGNLTSSFAAAPADISVETIVHGLDTPWAIAFPPDGRIFITERPGRIRVVDHGQLRTAPWITLDVATSGEAGLLGLAIDPRFAQNRFVYVAYSFRNGVFAIRNRLVRLREDPRMGQGIVDKVLIDDIPGSKNHDGGRVKFGPDGKLYWTMGDAQTTRYAQNLKSLNGKILRLNPDGTIPADNPWPNSYVYSYGHRNPQGLAWQPGTGRFYATEHGPSGFQDCCRDELNFIEPGKNYGWPVIRGDESKDGMISPIINSGSNDTWAPTGAAFVTLGPWAGSLLFTGLRGQALYRAILEPNNPSKVEKLERHLFRQFGRLRDVVEGPDKAFYVLTSNRDGRGKPADDDDRVIKIRLK
jgi:glucose/arabinose dehydrogenase